MGVDSEGRNMPLMPLVPLVNVSELRNTTGTISPKPRVTMAK